MPTVSVVIPTYGHRDFVRETLASVFAQTFKDIEVIVINDGSPDDTADVLRPFVASGRIRYVEQPNAGQAAARNCGLLMATGEFIAFLDDDDLWPPDKLAWQVKRLRGSDAVGIAGNCALLRDGRLETVIEPYLKSCLLPVDFFSRSPLYSPGQVLIRRSALAKLGGFDTAIWGTDDLDLWMRLSALGELLYVSRVALHYRVHAANASRHWERMLTNARRTQRKNIDLVPEPQRTKAAITAEQFNYFCIASDQIQRLWSLKPARWAAAAKALRHFALPAVRHPRLAVAILRDVIPIRHFLKPKA